MESVGIHTSPASTIIPKESMMVCPNCRSTISPCVAAVACPLLHATSCQGCLASPCIRGIVPHFPLPYVCRHWLEIPRPTICSSAPCSHYHSCSSDVTKSHSSSTLNFQFQNNHSGGGLLPSNLSLCKENVNFSSRQRSPDSQLILPDLILTLSSGYENSKPWTTEDDLKTLVKTKESLDTCGWYYGSMTWQEAASRLSNTSVGTFLIRNSSSSKCPYALSVQTVQGPTSIRIQYEKGKFWLDCNRKGDTDQMNGVVELVVHYVNLAKTKNSYYDKSLGKHVWLDSHGKVFNHITVTKALIKEPLSLQHLSRLAINKCSSVAESQMSSLPETLKTYLKEYHHTL